MNYKLLVVFLIVALMVVSPTMVGLVADGQALENGGDNNLDKSNIPDITVELYITSTGEIKQMSLEEYVCGVLLAEVPSFYEKETLKAMAVAARSYCMRRIQNEEKKIEHISADMCDDYSHCLGYISVEDALELWGESNINYYYSTIEQAVDETRGEVISYNGGIADTVFHASSCGVTECAENVWGFEIPYLVSVHSPEPNIEKIVEYSPEEMRILFEKNGVLCALGGEPQEWIECIKKNNNNRVEEIKISGVKITGRRAREIFGLSSASFDVNYIDGKFRFKTIGSGHGVGLSMAGANCMAQDGVGYRDILLHYYSGTKLILFSE
ncbi:MAG: stage II sporulation protein D [Clostridia bacterium]|nr:stage II sporulation protein D [Clostridia bacterium]